MTSLPRAVKLLIGGASLVGIGCLAIRVPEITRWDARDLLAVAVVAALTIAAERYSIPLRRGSETVNFALTDGVWAGALLLVTPGVLTVSVLLGVVLGQTLNRWKPFKIAYNVSQFLIGLTLAELIFAVLGGWGSGATDPARWAAVLIAMFVAFAVNATAIMLVVSMVEGTRFLDVFRLPLAINVLHWLGNVALGILGALVWAAEPIALILMIAPVGLAYITYRRWVEGVKERDQMRSLYEAGRVLSAPMATTERFGDFLGLLEKLLPADRVELVVVDDSTVAVHTSSGIRHLTIDDAGAGPLDAFVAVRSGVAPQIALVGDGDDVRGVLAVYRKEVLTATERVLLDGFASQIAARLWNHRLYGKTLERARLSEIVSHTSDGVFTVDTDGLIRTWNPAMRAIVGYSEDDAIGKRCEELLGLGMITVLSADEGNGRLGDTTATTKDGGTKELRLRTSTIRDDEDSPPQQIVVVRDAGEEMKAEQIKRDFVSMVSHELRSPLTPLRGFLTSLVEGTVDDAPEKRQEYYRIMLRQAQRLERVVNDMLDVSLIEAGGLVVDLQPMPLGHVLSRVVTEFREQHADRPVVMSDLDRATIVFADPFRVEQIVLNLLTNADKYTPAGLPITVGTRASEGSVTISVSDLGEGIAPEHCELVFDRFYRVQNGAARRPGTGLGLYIARTLVEAMSGRIWVDSELGAGTTFSFSLQTVDVDRMAELTLDDAEASAANHLIRTH